MATSEESIDMEKCSDQIGKYLKNKGLFILGVLLYIISDVYRLMRYLWLICYQTLWKLGIERGKHFLMRGVQGFSMNLALSPHRSLTYLFLFWLIGIVWVKYLEGTQLLVMNMPSTVTTYITSDENKEKLSPKDNWVCDYILNPISDHLKIKNNNNYKKYLSCPNRVESITPAIVKYEKENFEAYERIAVSKQPCASVRAPTFALDLLLPVFKLNEASICTIADEAHILLKFLHLLYQIIGTILAGLTLFSWAGILQNRLSR